jgi:transcriptional regulator with XRE-family HTH domain
MVRRKHLRQRPSDKVRSKLIYDDISIGKRLKALRCALGLSQVELCAQCGIPGPSWNAYERGKKRISVESLYDLTEAFDVTYSWVYVGNEDRLPDDLIKKLREYESSEKGEALPPARQRG